MCYDISFLAEINKIKSNKYLVGAVVVGFLLQFIVMGVPVMQRAFKLQLLDAAGWLHVLLLGLIPVFVSELVKALVRSRKQEHEGRQVQ